jgi:hypothetical protein
MLVSPATRVTTRAKIVGIERSDCPESAVSEPKMQYISQAPRFGNHKMARGMPRPKGPAYFIHKIINEMNMV